MRLDKMAQPPGLSATESAQTNSSNPPQATAELLAEWTNANPENLDPRMYVYRPLTAAQEARHLYAGIKESPFVPNGVRITWPETKYKQMSLRDLEGYRPTQLRFLFPHPKEDRSDFWFENLISDLFIRVEEFSKSYFDRGFDFPASYRDDPWSEGISPQFIDIASHIARCDPARGGWSQLLTDRRERSFLVTGVISKILEMTVFSELLFGCDDEAVRGFSSKIALEALDKDMLQDEGYYRKSARVTHIRRLLHTADQNTCKLPPKFWTEVDLLATRTTSALLPLLNLLRRLDAWRPSDSLAGIHQELHNIIAQAAYISICMAWSKSVFRVTFPLTGQFWELEFDNYDESAYTASVNAAKALDEAADAAEAPGEAADPGDNAEKLPPPPMRAAKVKLVVWPLVERFTPLSDATGYGAVNGDKITRLFKAQVVYYAGSRDPDIESTERIPLQAYVEHVETERRARQFWFPWAVSSLCILILVLLLLQRFPGGAAKLGNSVRHGLVSWERILPLKGGLLDQVGRVLTPPKRLSSSWLRR